MPLPLKKVRVLDFTHLLPGELCSTILSDLGCDVVRVESLVPGLGKRLPPVVQGESLYYWSIHRNKKRVGLDLKNAHGAEIARELASQADVVLENFRPGVMTRLGIGYRRLSRLNKRLIFCSISGYGQNSAWSQRPGHDLNYIAEAGILSLNRGNNTPPVIPGVLISDYMAAIYAALSVVSALYERQRTGKGKHLDISMFECALSTLNILATALLYTGRLPEEGGFTYQTELPNYSIYECRDGRYLAVASLEAPFWERFCQRLDRPQWIKLHPPGTSPDLKAEIAKIIKSKALKEWLTIFQESDCCVSPVHTLSEALAHLPARERGVVTHLVHPVLGNVPQLASPMPMKDQAGAKHQAGLDWIETTERVLKGLGYSQSEIKKLKEAAVIPK